MSVVACINGSPRQVSRTAILVDRIGAAVQAKADVSRMDIPLSAFGIDLFSGLTRASLSVAGERVCRAVEGADLLVVASPVYRASCSGILKHLFDLVERDAMRGKIAVLAATGGTALHGLMIEHQMRPLMGFFGIRTVATALYAVEDEVGLDGTVAPCLLARIEAAAEEAVASLRQPAPRRPSVDRRAA